jgi:hypothetical protein
MKDGQMGQIFVVGQEFGAGGNLKIVSLDLTDPVIKEATLLSIAGASNKTVEDFIATQLKGKQRLQEDEVNHGGFE